MERNVVYGVGSIILAHQLQGLDPANVDQSHLALIANLAVRAATELDAAIDRAEAAARPRRMTNSEIADFVNPPTNAMDQSKPQDPQKPPAPPSITKAPAQETKAGDVAG